MVTQVVTGYVPIPGHPREAAMYGELGEKIFKPLAGAGVQIRPFYETLDMCWMHKYVSRFKVAPTHSAGDNGAKNTLAYHCVQHQKFAWLLKAAIQDPKPDMYVWIDYGIGHVPGVDEHVIWDFLQAIKSGDLAIPGCWPKDTAVLNDYMPCWRFCGGVLVVPRKMVHKLYKAVKGTALDHINRTKNVTWEVNTLAEAEKEGRLPKFRWYQADHNETLFTAYDPAVGSSSALPSDTCATPWATSSAILKPTG